MQHWLIDLSGWFPAVIFPTATAVQLLAILRTGSTRGVSITTWTLFGVANIAAYIYTEKYAAIQTIIGYFGTALLDFIIASLAWRGRHKITSP
jgi:hypothetical protein